MYSVYNFNGVTLPLYNPETQWNTPSVQDGTVKTAGGYYDRFGEERAPLEYPYTITYSFAIVDDTPATLTATLDTLRAQVGNRGLLYRYKDEDNADVQWASARLLSAPQVRQAVNRAHQELTLEFGIYEAWRRLEEGVWVLDSGVLLDDSRSLDEGVSTTFTLVDGVGGNTTFTNSGVIPSTDIFMAVTAVGADITYFQITGDGWDLIFGNAFDVIIPQGQSMIVDAKLYSIKVGGANAYNILKFGTGHKINDWIRVNPGSNTVSWVASGGSNDSILLFQYYPQFI